MGLDPSIALTDACRWAEWGFLALHELGPIWVVCQEEVLDRSQPAGGGPGRLSGE